MAAHYRRQVANLAQVLNREENRAEAADILRSEMRASNPTASELRTMPAR
jgi:hypothetical protein